MTCYTNSGHRVHNARGVHVECDTCGYQFADIDNTGGLPPHDDETDASEPREMTATDYVLCSMCAPRGVSVRKLCPTCGACIHICRGANNNPCQRDPQQAPR